MQTVDKKGEFQKLLFGKIKDEQYLIGYKDKKITFVNYEGEEDIKQYVDDIYKMLEAV
ncbi:hypothetical protein SAMN02745248_02173 [Hathewaya proteolytica DSM 3090]|uniref:Uncharacterized protein n=1 Tax=Hathewaya proteolytica DSM 3090 TaxID=1121331 RepID=A0A1M6QZR8_9CLOT|nr:hypothetical protein [Hathewaya proteolytica]SHK25735.1 hypothetical protein SAMN02745248_02173 [Hathewaya proteolytica DSM 3090]